MRYHILSLDGGGAWALLQVRALQAIHGENAAGHDVLRCYDMVAATSGGSLVLGGLVEGLTLRKLLGFFNDEDERRAVFSPTRSASARLMRRFLRVGARYSTEAKLPALLRVMPEKGSKHVADVVDGLCGPAGAAVHLLIVAFNYDTNRAALFRSSGYDRPGAGRGMVSDDISLADAIHASTNAPIMYFDAPAHLTRHEDRFWDGGLTGLNNPVLAAVTEALALGHAPHHLRVLSLGTGTVQLPVIPPDARRRHRRAVPGFLSDVAKAAHAILGDPPDFATYVAHMVTGAAAGVPKHAGGRVIRLNPLIARYQPGSGEEKVPEGFDETKLRQLEELDMDAVEQWQVELINEYGDLWLCNKAPNQPVRAEPGTLKPGIGHATFAEGRKVWEVLRRPE